MIPTAPAPKSGALTTPVATARPLARRIGDVLRLQAANPWPTLITPWIIFGVIFGLNLTIWYCTVAASGGRDQLAADAFSNNGGGTWFMVFLLVSAIHAMNLTFRFALGMGFTRRDYYVGTVLYFAMLAAMFATGVTVMAGIERATNGWGVGGRFFMPWDAAAASWWRLWLVILLVALAFIAVGIASATMWVRLGAMGLYIFFGSVAVFAVGIIWLVTWAEKWHAVGHYLTSHSPLTITSWTLPVTVVSIAFGYIMLRRATPAS